MRLGYACINMTLRKNGIRTNRSAIKRTFKEKGPEHIANLTLQNSKDLLKVLEWNEAHNIRNYRISSDLIPWASEIDLDRMPRVDEIRFALRQAGDFARQHGHRVTFHPGQFNCLASPREHVILNSIKDLEYHAWVADALGLPRSPDAVINIHVGGAYGDRDSALDRFCKNFERLSEGVRTRLTVENDDKKSCYSTLMLYEGVHRRIGIPVVFDSHHWSLGPQDQDYESAIRLAAMTWPEGVRQNCHHSNSRRELDDPKASPVSHSDFYATPFDPLDLDPDVDLECKKKEVALLKYREDFGNEMA